MLVTGGTVAEGLGAGIGTAAERTETGLGQSPHRQGERGSAKQALMSCHLEVSYLVLVLSQAWQLQQLQFQQQVVLVQPLQVHSTHYIAYMYTRLRCHSIRSPLGMQ